MSFDPLDPLDPYDDRIRGPAGPPPPQSIVPAYRDPLDDPYAGDPNRGAARKRVLVPAILLIVVGVLNLVTALGCVPMGLICYVLPPEMVEAQMERQNPGEAAQLKQANMTVKDAVVIEGHVWMVGGVAALLTGLLVLAGGVAMLNLRWYGLAVFGTLMALISPAGCLLFLVGVIAGIWALAVLFSDDVRTAFR